jgi:hypothetical protein
MKMQSELEDYRSEIEKVMMGINNNRTKVERCMYLAGYIDCMFVKGLIIKEIRDTLYAEYCF